MITVFLIGFAALAVYAMSLWKYPFRPCLKCKGTGVNKGSSRKRWGMCRRCGGSRQVRRTGSTFVHRFYWSVLGSRLRERRKEQVKAARGKAGYPEL